MRCARAASMRRVRDAPNASARTVSISGSASRSSPIQTTMYALAAHVYPTEIRSTGVGTAVAFGRIGNALAVYVGGFALDQGGSAGYFTCWAVLMAVVFLSLAVVRRHVPRTAGVPVGAPAGAH